MTTKATATHPIGTKPMLPLLIGMALPPCISMLIQSLYNIIDSIYVAKLGESALTAVSLAFPLQNIVISLAVGLGIGMNASIARNLGTGNLHEANRSVSHGFFLASLHSLLFLGVGLFLSAPFIRMFTDDPQIHAWGTEYCRIVICLSFGSIFHVAIEKIFQSVGNMLVPMCLQVVGALVNIILDPIFIFGYFGVPAFGVKGAAIATIIGQCCACSLSLLWFFHAKLPVKISFKDFKPDLNKIKELYMIAIPSTIVMAIPSALVGLLNGLLIHFSETAVAVFGVYFKLQTFVYMPANGLVQGMRPIISFNFGSENPARMKSAIKNALMIVGSIMLIGTLIFLALATPIMSIFTQDTHMFSLGTQALRIISLGFVFSTPAIIFAGALESIGKGFHSLSIVFLRQLIFVPIFALILSSFLGLTGIWIAFPLAELCGVFASFLLVKPLRRVFS